MPRHLRLHITPEGDHHVIWRNRNGIQHIWQAANGTWAPSNVPSTTAL
ncbi:MAG: hypothetical protein ACRENP_29975 [Longimicrobiales bacterium]